MGNEQLAARPIEQDSAAPTHRGDDTLGTMTERFLPAVRLKFSLEHSEPVAAGLHRLSLIQFDKMLSELNGGGSSSFEGAVHQTRKATKRVRALLRLVRSEIGERTYQAENRVLRDVSRAVSVVRDDRVLVTTVAGIRGRYSDLLAPHSFAGLEATLDQWALRRRNEFIFGDALGQVMSRLVAARARYQAWPLEGDAVAGLYGRKPIRNQFSAIGPGLEQTYRRGRAEMETALHSRRAADLHAWRKRVKYLRHQIEILTPVFPEMLGATSSSFDRLGESLGEEHDLAELVSLLDRQPQLCPDPVERTMLVALAQHRRARLVDAAAVLGSRVYAESPRRFIDRVESYWQAGPLALAD